MNNEEIREYIFAKRTAISHCVDLTRYFIGRHKTLPIFLTPAFEMEFNRSMQELEILREQVKKQKEFIEYMNKTIEELECDDVDDEEMKDYLIQRIYTFKEIFSKYKEITGGK